MSPLSSSNPERQITPPSSPLSPAGDVISIMKSGSSPCLPLPFMLKCLYRYDVLEHSLYITLCSDDRSQAEAVQNSFDWVMPDPEDVPRNIAFRHDNVPICIQL